MKLRGALFLLLVALVTTAGNARAELVAWDIAYFKQLQAQDRFILVELTSFR